jgi:hypothetical protein
VLAHRKSYSPWLHAPALRQGTHRGRDGRKGLSPAIGLDLRGIAPLPAAAGSG